MTGGRIGVGIIGLSANGRWAATAHVPALRALPDFEIRGLVASSPSSAQAAARKFGVPYFTDDVSELAARPDIDLLVVTVKLPEHRALVMAALNAGKMVYCEWPLGIRFDEARALADKAKASGIRTFIGLQARAAPTTRFLRDLVADGYVGEVLSTTLVASVGQPWGGEVGKTSTYLLDAGNGATLLSIPFGHTIDAFCEILGTFSDVSATIATRRRAVRVIETGEMLAMTSPDQVAVTGVLRNGAVAAIHYRAGSLRGIGFRWEINGSTGDIVVEGENGHMQYGRVNISGAQGQSKALAPLPVPDRYQHVDLPPFDLSYTVAHAYRNVAHDIKSGTQKVPNFNDCLAVHAFVEAVEAASHTGQRHQWTPAGWTSARRG